MPMERAVGSRSLGRSRGLPARTVSRFGRQVHERWMDDQFWKWETILPWRVSCKERPVRLLYRVLPRILIESSGRGPKTHYIAAAWIYNCSLPFQNENEAATVGQTKRLRRSLKYWQQVNSRIAPVQCTLCSFFLRIRGFQHIVIKLTTANF